MAWNPRVLLMGAHSALLVGACGALAGCAGPAAYTTWHTPADVPVLPDRLGPTEVQFDVLELATGEACGAVATSAKEQRARAEVVVGLEAGMGDPLLYQSAKYAALATVPDADNLTGVRVKVTQEGDDQCVQVTGRAYRISSMRTVAAAATGPAWVSLEALSPPPEVASRRSVNRGGSLVLTVGAPTYGLPGYLGLTGRAGWFGWDAGVVADTRGQYVGPVGGIAIGHGIGSRVRPYGAARLGYSIANVQGPWIDLLAGTDLGFGRFVIRVETGGRVSFDGGGAFLLNAGPSWRF